MLVNRVCTPLNLLAATIFMALVIFLIEPTAFNLRRTKRKKKKHFFSVPSEAPNQHSRLHPCSEPPPAFLTGIANKLPSTFCPIPFRPQLFFSLPPLPPLLSSHPLISPPPAPRLHTQSPRVQCPALTLLRSGPRRAEEEPPRVAKANIDLTLLFFSCFWTS